MQVQLNLTVQLVAKISKYVAKSPKSLPKNAIHVAKYFHPLFLTLKTIGFYWI